METREENMMENTWEGNQLDATGQDMPYELANNDWIVIVFQLREDDRNVRLRYKWKIDMQAKQ